MERRAVFLDRDGVINTSSDGWVTRPEDLVLLPGVPRAVRRLNEAGWLAVVVTNQSAVGRGLMTAEDVARVNERMRAELNEGGARLDGVYLCLHAPGDGCPCRKPLPGLLLQAAEELRVDLARSVMVGDSERDIQAGKGAGCVTIAVTSGKHNVNDIEAWATSPDAIREDLAAAVDLILSAGSTP